MNYSNSRCSDKNKWNIKTFYHGVKRIKTAIISDINGDYPALVSVLKDTMACKVDHFIFAGDYIFDLPYSNQVTGNFFK